MNQNNSPSRKLENNSVLFVSDLPRDANEEDVYLFFKNYHCTQVKINKNKYNTFAYVYFENCEYANKARKELNGEIFTSKYSKLVRPMRICKYEMKTQVEENTKDSSRSLLVKNLDKSITAKQFFRMFEEFGEVKSSKLEVDENGVSKNYGYIFFSETKSAEAAKQTLNGKEISGKILEIVNLVPSKSKDSGKNNIYVKHFPRDFNDEDLKKLFEKYGEITSALVSRDDRGLSKGFGFVCFAHTGNAVEAIKDLKENEISFPGLAPLYVNFAMKKEERSQMTQKERITFPIGETAKFMVSCFDPDIVSPEDYDRELRLFIKVVLLQEYSPKLIEINMNLRTSVVTMNSMRDLEEFLKKYAEYSSYNYPKFMVQPYIEQSQPIMNPVGVGYMPNAEQISHMQAFQLGNPVNINNLMDQFGNMSIHHHPHQVTPVMYVDPNRMVQPPMMKLNMPNMLNSQQKFPLKQNFKQPNMKQIINPILVNQMNHMNTNHQGVQYRGDFVKSQIHMHEQIPISGQKITTQQINGINPFINNQMNKIPVSITPPNISKQISQPKQQSIDDQNELEDIAAEIYDVVESKYPDDAGKITGMIVDFGIEEMKILINQRDKLCQVIDEAHDLLHK